MLERILTDSRLVERVVQKNSLAFEELVNRYERKLYQFCWHILKEQFDAEDMVQQTFLNFWLRPQSYDPTKGTLFSTWLYQVAKNNCLDQIRKNKKTSVGDNAEWVYQKVDQQSAQTNTQPQTHYQREERSRLVQQAINQLTDPNQHMIVILFYLQEESYNTIATIMNMSSRMVEGHLYRAKKKMKRFLEKK